MLGPETIRQMSDVAAYQAAEEGKEPLIVWSERDFHHVPFLGDYTPAGWRRATWTDVPFTPRNVHLWPGGDAGDADFMVDSSGFGRTDEPALSYAEAYDYVSTLNSGDQTFGVAVRESGEFQVYLTLYLQDPESEGNPAPTEEAVACSSCHTVHGPFDECDFPEETCWLFLNGWEESEDSFDGTDEQGNERPDQAARCKEHRGTDTCDAHPEVEEDEPEPIRTSPGQLTWAEAMGIDDEGHIVDVRDPREGTPDGF